MKHSLIKKCLMLGTLAAVAAGTSACKLPADYRGTYTGSGMTLKVNFTLNKAMLTLADGRKIEAKAEDLEIDAIASGRAGLYIRDNKDNANITDVLWIQPKGGSLHDEQGFVWMDAEVAITRMTKKQPGKAQTITVLHCDNGQVMVDKPTGLYNGGCPAGTAESVLSRK